MKKLVTIKILLLIIVGIYLLTFLLSSGGNLTSDLNLDGKVDICDLSFLQSVILGKIEGVYICDINGDGKLDISDLQVLLNEIGNKPAKKGENRCFNFNSFVFYKPLVEKKNIQSNYSFRLFEVDDNSDRVLNSCLNSPSDYPIHKGRLYLELGLMINAPPQECLGKV